MRKSRRPIVIAARPSRLAKVQAEMVGRALARLHPHVAVEYKWIESEGDQRTNASLADSGGKGLFATAVEQTLLRREADIAVHSLKDLPTDLTPGLSLAAIPKRADARDCLIAPEAKTIGELPPNAVVGTASPRRAGQLLRLRHDLNIQLLRGNIETRIRRILDEQRMDATLLAAAGLKRAGLKKYADKPINMDDMLPAAAQGALAVQVRSDDHMSMTRCLPLNDPATSAAVYFERAVIAGLNGNCHSAIAVHAAPSDGDARRFDLRARVIGEGGDPCIEVADQADAADLTDAATRMVDKLNAQGAADLLKAQPARPTQPARA